MIVSEKIDANNSFQITLSPNNSLSWGGNLLFLFFVSFPILVIAITFAIAGAPIILPFAGLEILVVTTAIWYISKRNNRQEVIKLSFDKLIISARTSGKQNDKEGISLFIIGIFISFFSDKFSWFGNLVGDINYKSNKVKIFIPISSMLILSILISIIINIINKLFK